MKTAKGIRKNIESLLNAANYDECNKAFCNVIEKEIINYAKQEVKERDEQWKLILNKVSTIEDEVGNLFIRMDEIEDLIKLEFK